MTVFDEWPDFCRHCGSKKLDQCMRGAAPKCERTEKIDMGQVTHCGWCNTTYKTGGAHSCADELAAKQPKSYPREFSPVPLADTDINRACGLPTDPAERKAVPIYSGVLRYFPDALAAVAELSKVGNDQHNPGEPLHWAREKSGDELDALTRHLMDAGTLDTDGLRHSAKVAWRALANLQKEIEVEAGIDPTVTRC